MEAFEQIREDAPGAGVLAVTSPDRLARGWFDAQADRAAGRPQSSHVERLLAKVPRGAPLVTMMDGPPTALSWLGGVRGHRVSALGVTRFGQTGDIQDLYRAYRLDAEAAVEASAVGSSRGIAVGVSHACSMSSTVHGDPMKTRAAVAFAAKQPLEIVEVDLEGPKAGEVLVEIKATGICHTDAYTLDGLDSEGIFPSILGHEGAGRGAGGRARASPA